MTNDEAFVKLLARFDAVLDKCERIAMALEYPPPHVHASAVSGKFMERCVCGARRVRPYDGPADTWEPWFYPREPRVTR